jgi:hypothetical protein
MACGRGARHNCVWSIYLHLVVLDRKLGVRLAHRRGDFGPVVASSAEQGQRTAGCTILAKTATKQRHDEIVDAIA